MIALLIWYFTTSGWFKAANWFDFLLAIVMVCGIIFEVVMCIYWFNEGYYVDRYTQPSGWKKWEYKTFSVQWFIESTNMNKLSCVIFACIITTFLLDLYKVVTFAFDMFWFITHCGNEFYKKER